MFNLSTVTGFGVSDVKPFRCQTDVSTRQFLTGLDLFSVEIGPYFSI